MTQAEFDEYADDYDAMHRRSIAFSGCEPAYFAEYKVSYAARIAAPCNIIVDFGSGTGNSIPYFRKYFSPARLVCADISTACLKRAAMRFPGNETQLEIAGDSLDLPSDYADLVFSACVFHHIPSDRHVRWLADLKRVTRPGGRLIVFEHNPWNPLTRRAVAQCAFDRDAVLITAPALVERLADAGWISPVLRYHVFFPGFLARLRPLETLLGRIPFGGQYSVIARKH